MKRTRCLLSVAACSAMIVPWLNSARAATPSAPEALALTPIQRGVEIDTPDAAEAAQCSMSARRVDDSVGWVVEDPGGMVLRQFLDTNADKVVDRWSYYKDGLEVYRDIDSDFDGKADQCRWFHTAGSRWGVDENEDGKIDVWRMISAEEVTAEAVAALAHRDVDRFTRLVLTPTELKSLGLGKERAEELSERIGGLKTEFAELAGKQTTVTPTTQWVQFSGNHPGIVPAGKDGATKDLRVYESVVAIVETDGSHGQVNIGTLIEVGDVWRLIDVPRPMSDAEGEVAGTGFFFLGPGGRNVTQSAGPSDEIQEHLAELEKLDSMIQSAGRSELAVLNAKRADLVEKVAEMAPTAEEREMWLRQLAETVSAAVQSGEYPEGVKRLEALYERLRANPQDEGLASYVLFRQMSADYAVKIQAPDAPYAEIQADWLKQLEQYIEDYPTSLNSAEAMLQLAIAREFGGQIEEAKKWYGRIVAEFPDARVANMAAGAQTRLECVGRSIRLQGKSPSGEVVDLADYRGHVVLIQYWASWCEPCKADMATLKELYAKFGQAGFRVIGINLDSRVEDMAGYLSENRLPWPQIHEEGGMESRPANELGILTLPTMILLDREGKVVDRNIQIAELRGELEKLLR